MIFGLFFLKSLTAASNVVFHENEGVLTDVTMEGTLPNGKSWVAIPFHTRNEEDTNQLEKMYANPETMKYWQDGSCSEGDNFKKVIASLNERSSVRFGAGNPHGVLLVRDGDGNCIGHAVIGQHFGHKCVGVSAFFFTPQAWLEGYAQAVANVYFNQWAPEVVKREFTCFTGPKASDDWGSDEKLHYLMMLSHPDNWPEIDMMRKNGFGPLTSWENLSIENIADPFNSSPEQEVANNLSKFWDANGLLDNKFYNVSINGVVRSVIKLPFGFRFGFWRNAIQTKAKNTEADADE